MTLITRAREKLMTVKIQTLMMMKMRNDQERKAREAKQGKRKSKDSLQPKLDVLSRVIRNLQNLLLGWY